MKKEQGYPRINLLMFINRLVAAFASPLAAKLLGGEDLAAQYTAYHASAYKAGKPAPQKIFQIW